MHRTRNAATAAAVAALCCLFAGHALAQGVIIIEPPIRPVPPDRPARHTLELRQHQVSVTIDDQIATTRIEHVFYNPSGSRLEGTFIFPMPEGANIDTFEMDVNGKMTEAELLDADKARKIYEDIVRSMRDPALLEYDGRGALKARIFPIEPNSEKRVTLEYTHLLPADAGTAEYVYPITARSIQGRAPGRLSMKIELNSSAPLANLYCPTHTVEIKRRGDHKAVVGFESDQLGESDFKLYISPKAREGDVGLTLMTYRDGKPDALGSTDGYFLLLASPSVDTTDIRPIPKDITFVLDTSGSMQGDKLAQAKKALKFCVENLNDDDRFQIVRFSTDSNTLFDALAPADDEHRTEAYDYIDGLKPIGGTAIEEALDRAVTPVTDRKDTARPYYVIFLTDGRPTIGETDTDRIIHNAITRHEAAEQVRVFCFGIGTDINTKLLDKITETTRATTEYVLPDEDIEIKVSRFYTKISEPVLSDPRITLAAHPAARVAALPRLRASYPQDLPDLFKGEQVVAVGRYSDPSGGVQLNLIGSVRGKEQAFTVDGRFVEEAVDHAFIPRLWATRRVGYLLDELRLHGEQQELRDEVIELARAYGIVTPYTSYLIVEDEQRRNVPLARRSLQEVGARGDGRFERSRVAFDEMAKGASGEGSVRGAQSNLALKSALSAPAAAEAADDFAQLGIDAREPADTTARRVSQQAVHRNGKTFVLNHAQWVDTEAQRLPADAQVNQLVFNSDEYFAFARAHPDAMQWLSVGQQVQVVVGGQLYEVVPE